MERIIIQRKLPMIGMQSMTTYTLVEADLNLSYHISEPTVLRILRGAKLEYFAIAHGTTRMP